ncbi:hypothetical protein [Comamonas sp.]|uniref:hypothetical protein n=1 Tax=Comamonas sp. TaxID=34028 RepID=UPI0028A9DF81|nr:hypothetical protein [Comamonas sp.]
MTKPMPENTDALSLAAWIDSDFDPDEMLERGYDAIATELRRLSKVEAAFSEWIEKTDWVQRTAKPAELGVHRADVLANRIAALEAELKDTNDMNQQLRDQNTAVDAACAALERAGIEAANRAAAAEQQVTALTQRLDMANRLNTDAREQLAQLNADHQTRTVVNKANSSKCVINKDVQWKCGNEYLPYHPDASHVDPAYRDGWNDCYRSGTPPHKLERLTDEQIARAAVNAGMKPIYDKPKKPMVNALGSSVPFTWLKAFAHGIGATND